MTLQVAGLSKS